MSGSRDVKSPATTASVVTVGLGGSPCDCRVWRVDAVGVCFTTTGRFILLAIAGPGRSPEGHCLVSLEMGVVVVWVACTRI